MAKQRFRDTKKGKITPKEPKKTKSSGFVVASKGDYFKAILTDSFMLWMPIMYIVFYAVFGDREGFAAHKMAGWLYILVPLVLIEVAFLAKSGQTPGMRAYKLKLLFVTTESIPPFSTILLRQILSKVAFLTFGWIYIFFAKDRRPLQDIATGCAIAYDNSKK